MQKLAHEVYSFDEFHLDLTRGSLFRGEIELKLRPKSFDVLKYLTQNHGRLVSKDELIEAVWRETAVTDDSLVQCLKDIRRALDDDTHQIIKTLPRRGYMFDKVVSSNDASVYTEDTAGFHIVLEETVDDETQNRENPAVQQRSKPANLIAVINRQYIAAMIVSVVLIAVVLAGLIFYRPLLAWWFKPPSIAVLPIVNMTGDAETDYVSDGLTESIITSLTQLNEGGKNQRLRVIAQNTVFIFKNKEFEPRSVGRDLGVDIVLVGKMFRPAGLQIFKFEMISVSDGSIMWSRQYSSGFTEPLLTAQNEIPRDIAAELPVSLSDADRENLTRRYTQNEEAYDLFLKGRAEFRKVTPSGLRKSIEYFQQAINLEAKFAPAYFAMGMSYRSQGNIDERADNEANEKAVELFQKALRIDNNLTLASVALKSNEAGVWDWKAIERAGPTHPGYGRYLLAAGRPDEKLELEKRQLLNNPFAPFLNFTHCNTLLALRRTEEAIAQCQKTLNIVPAADKAYFGPESPWIHLLLGLAFSQKNMYAEAENEMKLAVDLGENSKTLLAELGAVYAKSGQRGKAMEILEQLQDHDRNGEYFPSLNVSHIYISLGDKDQAFFWLNKAIDEREERVINVRFSDTYDSLRGDARFAELLRRLNLPT
jgi:DNA-binding winged helix-turn-helix (wHTH) protein/TolB-like protein/Flp pilus assembly protein TadD